VSLNFYISKNCTYTLEGVNRGLELQRKERAGLMIFKNVSAKASFSFFDCSDTKGVYLNFSALFYPKNPFVALPLR